MSSDKMITIKKADGTLEKISLVEFRARKNKNTTNISDKSEKIKSGKAEKSISVKMAVDNNKNISKKLPDINVDKISKSADKVSSRIIAQGVVHKIKTDLSDAKKEDETKSRVIFSKDDARSLLSEEIGNDNLSDVKHSIGRQSDAEMIVKKMNIDFPTNIFKRLVRLLHLYLKDLKSEDEVKEVLKSPITELGIGLSDAQVERIVKLSDEYRIKNGNNTDAKPLISQPGAKNTLMIEPNYEMQKYKKPLPPAVSTPNNSFVHGVDSANSSVDEFATEKIKISNKKEPNHVEKKISSTDEEFAIPDKKIPSNIDELLVANKVVQEQDIDNLVLKKNKVAHPIVQDITSSKMVSIGPVDELKYFTLVDFRRMSSRPGDAADRLKQKFINLRNESYILYLDALVAWRQSPLFNEYITASVEVLNTGKSLDSFAEDKKKIQINEIFALVNVQKELN